MQAGDYISSKERRQREEAASAAAAAAASAEDPPLLGAHPVLACAGIVVVVVSWIAKMALVQDMQTGTGGGISSGSSGGGGGNSTAAASEAYNKPFLLAYSNGSSYTFFGLVFLLFHLRLGHYFACWTWGKIRERCCGWSSSSKAPAASEGLGLDRSVQQHPSRRDSHSLSQVGNGSSVHHEALPSPSIAYPSSYQDSDASEPEPEDEAMLSQDGITPVGSFGGGGGGMGGGHAAKTSVAVVVQPFANTATAQHGQTENLGSNALLMQHLDRAAAARQHAEQRASAERRKRKLLRLAALQDSSHLPALTREERALLPQYSRLMRAAFLLSFLYQMCGWLTNASLNDTSLSVNTAIWNSGCVLVFLFEGLFLPGHSLRNTQKILGVLVCAAGVAIIAVAPTPADDSSTATPTTAWGVSQVLMAMLIYSAYEVLFAYMSADPNAKHKAGGGAAATAAASARGKRGSVNGSTVDEDDDEPDSSSADTMSDPTLQSLSLSADGVESGSSYDPQQSPSNAVHFASPPPAIASSYPTQTAHMQLTGTDTLALGINDAGAASAARKEKLLSSSDDDDRDGDSSGASTGKPASFASNSFATVPGLITAASATSIGTSFPSSSSSIALAAAASPALPASAKSGSSSSAMQSIWSSFLFLGTMGLSILGTEWLMVLILHYTGAERLQRPSPAALDLILASMGLDTILNVSILCSIALSTALFVQCGLLLTIPASILYDRLFHHQSPGWLSIVGVAVLVLGFCGLNLPRPKCLARRKQQQQQHKTAAAALRDPLNGGIGGGGSGGSGIGGMGVVGSMGVQRLKSATPLYDRLSSTQARDVGPAAAYYSYSSRHSSTNGNGAALTTAAAAAATAASAVPSRHHSSSKLGLPAPPSMAAPAAATAAASSEDEFRYPTNSLDDPVTANRLMARASLGMLNTHLLAE